MQQNPYAGPALGQEHDDVPPYHAPRTSICAVLALVCAMGCFVPGNGLLAVMLGVVGLRAVGKSNGGVTGKGPAGVAIILGLMVTVLQGAAAMGALQGWTFYTKQMAPVATEVMDAARAGDLDALDAVLTPDAAAECDAASLAAFHAQCTDAAGECIGVAVSLAFFVENFTNVFRNERALDLRDHPVVPVPVPVVCAKGEAVVWLFFDGETLENGTLRIDDVLVVAPDQARAVCLRKDGMAKVLADLMGYAIVEMVGADSTAKTPQGTAKTLAPAGGTR